jgi:hypothetical protein
MISSVMRTRKALEVGGGSCLSLQDSGQCAVILQTLYGGSFASTAHDGQNHWFNLISTTCGEYQVDITGDRFGLPKYQIERHKDIYPNVCRVNVSDMDDDTRAKAQDLAKNSGLEVFS